MQDKIETERAAGNDFFKNADPQDDYFVVTFHNGPKVLSNVTQSTAGIESAFGLLQPEWFHVAVGYRYIWGYRGSQMLIITRGGP